MVLSSRLTVALLWVAILGQFALLIWLRRRHIPIATDADILAMPVMILLSSGLIVSMAMLVICSRARARLLHPPNSAHSTYQRRLVVLERDNVVSLEDVCHLCSARLPGLSLLWRNSKTIMARSPKPLLTFGRRVSLSITPTQIDRQISIEITVEPVFKELILDSGHSYSIAESLVSLLSRNGQLTGRSVTPETG
jgi:hypothetical protein